MNSLITESLIKGDTSYVLPFNQNLLTKIEKQWVAWIHEYLQKHGQPPALARFEKEFSHNFTPVNSVDPLSDIYEQTLTEKQNVFVRTEITRHAEELKHGVNPMPIIEKIYKSIVSSDGGFVTSDFHDKSSYFRVHESFDTGIAGLDEVLGGIIQGDLVYIAGRPGDGKTTFLLHMIARWLWDGKRILMVSNEIPWADMMFKVDAILANMKISEKRSGKWSEESLLKLKFLQYIASIAPGKLIVPKGPVRQPSSVRAAIEQYKPDIVCIDGAYLMSPTGAATTEWGQLAEVSRELKQIAITKNVPIIGVLQANRNSEFTNTMSLGALAGTDAYGQDADTVIMLKSIGVNDGDKTVALHTSKNRNGAIATIQVGMDFREMTLYESSE